MNDSGNYAEYTVKRKAEGKYLKAKILWLAIYAVILIVYLSILVALSNYAVLVVIVSLPFAPVIVMILRHFTWNKFVAAELQYEIANAKITLSEIHGKKATEVFSEFVSAFDKIAPVRDEYKADYENADKVIEFRGTASSPDSYFMTMTKDGKKTVIFIEATNKAVKVMKFYNSKNIVTCDTLRY